MCTTTDNGNASENVEKKDRDIGILINLETYQDMTDSEIDRVIQFKAQRLANKTILDEMDGLKTNTDKLSKMYEKNLNTLNSICSGVIEFIPTYANVTLYDVNGNAVGNDENGGE